MNTDIDGHAIFAGIEAKEQIRILLNEMDALSCSDSRISTVDELDALEGFLHSKARQLVDLMTANRLQQSLDNELFREEVREFVKQQPQNLKNCGQRWVKIHFSGGTVIFLKVAYYTRSCDKKKRRKGQYPALLLLGIHDHCTPGLASEISMASAALCSYEEARHMLNSRGCSLNIKTIRNTVKRFAARARLTQQNDGMDFTSESNDISNRKVIVSTDGGRVRIRKKKTGPKTKKGRNRFKTDWREPKLFIIYIANEQGRLDKTFAPFLDGTLKGPDEVFAMMAYYLKKLKVNSADKLLFVADGALWIWDRVQPLISALNINAEQVYELIDFYHAVEHLSSLAKLKTSWTQAERDKWVRKHRRNLVKGETSTVIEAIKQACKGSKNKLVKRERAYFLKNESRMQYGDVALKQLPIGSGAMESSIRRVVNLRLKGACIYWNEDSANEMLLLRCYYKSGRWDMLKDMACKPVIAGI